MSCPSLLQFCDSPLSCLAVCWKWLVKLSLYCSAVPVSALALRKTYELRGVFALLGRIQLSLVALQTALSSLWPCGGLGHLLRLITTTVKGPAAKTLTKQHFSWHNSVICLCKKKAHNIRHISSSVSIIIL